MKFLWRCVLVIAALVAGSLLLAACGGEEELTLDEYFQRLEEVTDDAQTRYEKLDEKYEEAWEDVEATRDYMDDYKDIYKEALNGVKGLHPPPEARDAHDEFVAASAEMLALMEDFIDQLADVESSSELEELREEVAEEEKYEAASERFDDACLELKGIAEDNGIDVELRWCD